MRRLGTALLLGGLAVGCGPPTGRSQSGVPRAANPPTGAAASVEDRAAEQKKREEYQRQFQARMDQLNDEIKELGERAAKASADARVRLDRQLVDLKERQADLQKQWDSFKASSAGAWEEMKGGMDRAFGELRKSYDRAAAEFNKERTP